MEPGAQSQSIEARTMPGLSCRSWAMEELQLLLEVLPKQRRKGKDVRLSPVLQSHTEGRKYNLQVSAHL